VLAGGMHRDHVRVVERRGCPRLALEAGAELLVAGEIGGDHLERDRALKARV
jgi:hypothetical protein